MSYVRDGARVAAPRSGDWDEAERVAHGELERGITVVQLLAKTVLAELAVRRGDADARERVADLAAHADRAAEPQRLTPVIELTSELALTGGEPIPGRAHRRARRGMRAHGGLRGRFAARLAGWAAVAGSPDRARARRRGGPYARDGAPRLAGGRGRFGAIGWGHDRALMLSLLDDEGALAEAIGIARMLGAGPSRGG